MTAKRYLCVHAHFYQPSREDPNNGDIPLEKGAAPYPNWNEKIYAECYRPNLELGNFGKISFNIGPTLCTWMEKAHPDTLKKIIQSDRNIVASLGVGNAISQAYHHTILPLATYQDKVTQVRWGIADFEYRFGRKPQGMWLPETAVDLETLRVLADHDIQFTILSPAQAMQQDVDVTQPYRVQLEGGRSIVVFFYHAGLSGGISFNPQMTTNADQFVTDYLLPSYPTNNEDEERNPFIMLASDGELYGHHQPLRDYFLQRLMNASCELNQIKPTFPALWLKEFTVEEEILIKENTSWSCPHGLKRWSTGCECTPGDSTWKIHLRDALNAIAEALDLIFIDFTQSDFEDPWELRHAYSDVFLGKISGEAYLQQRAKKPLSNERQQSVLLLLRAQFERQRMFASDGWFFEDFDRIEPRNAVAYAAHAVKMTKEAVGKDISNDALAWLSKVKSPLSGLSGEAVFQRYY